MIPVLIDPFVSSKNLDRKKLMRLKEFEWKAFLYSNLEEHVVEAVVDNIFDCLSIDYLSVVDCILHKVMKFLLEQGEEHDKIHYDNCFD